MASAKGYKKQYKEWTLKKNMQGGESMKSHEWFSVAKILGFASFLLGVFCYVLLEVVKHKVHKFDPVHQIPYYVYERPYALLGVSLIVIIGILVFVTLECVFLGLKTREKAKP